MAGGVMVSVQPRKGYPGKFTSRVFWTCVVAATGGLIFGYDLGISGGVTSMAPFLKKFFPSVYAKEQGIQSSNQYCKFDSQILTLFTSSLYLAALVACIFASKLTKARGRKPTMWLGGLFFVFGSALNAFSVNLVMLILARLLLGFGVGFVNQSVPLYLSEMAPYKRRGLLNMMFQLAITIGILAANCVNYFTDKMKDGNGWRWSLGIAAIPGFIVFFGGLFLPETPNSLVERGYNDEAKVMLQKIRGIGNVDEEFDDLVAASVASKTVEDPWKKLIFNRRYRPHLIFAVLIPSFQQVTGINVIMFYAPVLFKTLGFGASTSLLSSLITGCVNVVATGIALYAVDKFGRRSLFLAGGAQLLIFQVAVGALIWKVFGYSGVGSMSQPFAVGIVFCICLYVAGFAYSWGPLGWLVPSEIFPLEVRSAAQSVNVAMNMLWTFVIAQIFLLMLCRLKFWLFFLFALCVVVMTTFIYFYFPETKGVPIEEMNEVWKQHPRWGKYIPEDDQKKAVEIV